MLNGVRFASVTFFFISVAEKTISVFRAKACLKYPKPVLFFEQKQALSGFLP